jgi:hypothetical protein
MRQTPEIGRRELLAGTAATALLLTGAPARADATREAVLTIGKGARGPTIPGDFLGLSYEAAQLANPAFFSPANRALVALFRELSPSGNLRIGGGSSAYAVYTPAAPAGPPPFETFGPDTSKTVKHQTPISDEALRNLRGFLDATGWRCLYGLDLARDSKDNAAAEAAAVQRILGDRLVAVQIGNEPDSYRTHYRPATWGPADFVREWNVFHDAIATAAPGIRFAGPDISNKLDYLTAFAADAPRHRDIVMLAAHYYALGPAGSPDATIAQLLSDDPKEATLHPAGLPIIAAAQKQAGLPFRVSEGNSCWNGGQPGVSDTFASALWCADTMLQFARRGWIGFNLHGGGNGHYAPIVGAPSSGFRKRPEFFGMQFFQMLSGGTFLPAIAHGLPAGVAVHAVEQQGRRRIAVVNKASMPVAIRLPAASDGRATLLTGPSLASKEGVRLDTAGTGGTPRVLVPPFAAALYTLRQ